MRLSFFLKKVFKLDPNGKEGPLLTLGRSMQPGSDQNHFCQPTDVAVDPDTGTIYVSDGYCNSRLVQFSPSGKFITQWGEGAQTLGLCFASGTHCPLREENGASICIQLVVYSLSFSHTHAHALTPTQSYRRKRMLLPKSFKLYPYREKICHEFVGKDTNCFTLYFPWFQIFSGFL